MKRILCMAVVFAMLLTFVNVSTLAVEENTLVITANATTVKPGETAEIKLTVAENPGVAYLLLTPRVDQTAMSWNAQNGDLKLDLDEGVNLCWSSDKNCFEVGVIATLYVAVNADVKPGDYAVSFVLRECYDEEGNNVSVSVATAMITVTCPHTNTTNKLEEPADCNSVGYTAGIYCEDCKTYISGHEEIAATGNHIHTEIRDAEAATATKPGYTGDTYCKDCGKLLTKGEEIPVLVSLSVRAIGAIHYTLNGNTVIVDHGMACKAGYLSGGGYVAIKAVANGDGTYSFTAPEGVTEVLLVVKGDVNGDGKISSSDYSRLNAVLLKKTTLTAEASFAADCNADGKISSSDYSRLNAILLKKTTLTW